MSAKAVLQGLEDSELIRIFLDFVSANRLNYEKHRKEISYKCYEATWVLPVAKATGYGRTETEAYKNALKNLLELLMEDPAYVQYFSLALTRPKNTDHSPPPKMQLKTQGHEPQEKQRSQYDSYAKCQQIGRMKADILHSKINLNRSMSQKGDPEVEEAKNKLKALQTKLASVLEENRILKQKLLNYDEKTVLKEEPKRMATEGGQQLRKGTLSQTSQKSLLGLGGQAKIAVPKLNLEVLPNYHKKSEKCLNDALLTAYQEKHGGMKVY